MKTENTKTNHINFDRHEIYCDDMMKLNMDLTWKTNGSVKNKLFGLMDGYLYSELKDQKYLEKNGCSFDTTQRIKILIMHIERKLNIHNPIVETDIKLKDGCRIRVLQN